MIQFNDKAYFYFKSWHIPEYEGIPKLKDAWLTLPANIFVGGGRFHTTTEDLRIAQHTMMIIRDDGMLVAVRRGRPGITVPIKYMKMIEDESIDVREWEQVMGRTWNFNDMFDTQQVEQRFAAKHGTDRAKYFLAPSDSTVFSIIFNSTKVQPCRNCGKRRV